VTSETVLAAIRWTRYSILIAGGVALLVLIIGFDFVGAQRVLPGAPRTQTQPSGQVELDIMPVKPGGPAENFAAYLPATTLNVPAQSVVTFTIRNFDLDSTSIPASSLATRVQGTVGGVAYADGQPYSTLDRMKIAHTFSAAALKLNVPIPGYSAIGKRYVTVTFSVRTGKSGVYAWRCMAPCGEGQDGKAGPMADDAYMRGMLFVQG
jgi:hypothetical protein